MKIILAENKSVEEIYKEVPLYNNSMDDSIYKIVKEILDDVENNKNSALEKYTNKFDGWQPQNNLKISANEIEQAYKNVDSKIIEALKLAAERIKDYHQKQLPADYIYQDSIGANLGQKWNPINSVGLYVPSGTAAYPSSVLMNAIPAIVAGVKKIVIATPAKNRKINNFILAAAKIAGIEEIYLIGGAQAIAALAFGTETITAVDKIVGPGNAYVAEAKRQVFGKVGIDTIAGPSEILVIADDHANPKFIAADLLSQAEHDVLARSILITNSKKIADEVQVEIKNFLKNLPRKAIAEKSLQDFGTIILVDDINQAAEISNKIAPEHIELMVEDAKNYSKKINKAGAIFIGNYTPEAVGDYLAGPSHVLPTSGAARFSAGLSVYDFLTRSSIIHFEKTAFDAISEQCFALAECEELAAHALSVKIRSTKNY